MKQGGVSEPLMPLVMFRPAFAPVGAVGRKRAHIWPFSLAENGVNSAQNFAEIQHFPSSENPGRLDSKTAAVSPRYRRLFTGLCCFMQGNEKPEPAANGKQVRIFSIWTGRLKSIFLK